MSASKNEIGKINLAFVKNGGIILRAKVIQRTHWGMSKVGHGMLRTAR